MKSAALILLASFATLAVAENEVKCFGHKVEYISAPETCDIKARIEQVVLFNYTVTLMNGTKFVEEGRGRFEIDFPTCRGFEPEILGMCVGEKRRIVVASELDYGLDELRNTWGCSVSSHCLDQSALKMFGYRVAEFTIPLDYDTLDKGIIIPGGSTLYHDIELIEAYYPDLEYPTFSEIEETFNYIDIDGDSALSREEVRIYFKKRFESSNEDKLVEDFFNSEDKDKNGYISLEEYSDLPRHHDEL